MMGLVVNDVHKSYKNKKAVAGLSFILEKPGVFGLLGTNGAGKTTTIRMILGILKKDQGSITWNGKAVTRENVNFGYLPEERGIYPKTKVGEQLIYFAMLKGMSRKEAIKSLNKWAKKLEVEEYIEMTAEKLSKGNQQKVQFLTCVMHDPELIILDEPFSGLDPINTDILKNVVRELIAAGKYIIMSSHQMASVEEFCDDILILNRGKTVLQGNLTTIKNSYDIKKLALETTGEIKNIIEESDLKIYSQKNHEYIITLEKPDEAEKLMKKLVNAKIPIIKFELLKPTLHDIFIEKVGGK